MIFVNCDGSITGGNPGGRGYTGFVVKNADGTQVIHRQSDDLGAHPSMSNNVAEYAAVLSALIWLRDHGYAREHVVVYTDSQLVVRQLQGHYQCSVPLLINLRDRVLKEATNFKTEYAWVPREQNQEADYMSKSLQR